jgi:hypothetical protein
VATTSGTYSVLRNRTSITVGINFYLINGASGLSASFRVNVTRPGTATTLSTMTSAMGNGTRSSDHAAAVANISGSTAPVTALKSTNHRGSGETPCSVVASDSISSTRLSTTDGTGNGYNPCSWSATSTFPRRYIDTGQCQRIGIRHALRYQILWTMTNFR